MAPVFKLKHLGGKEVDAVEDPSIVICDIDVLYQTHSVCNMLLR